MLVLKEYGQIIWREHMVVWREVTSPVRCVTDTTAASFCATLPLDLVHSRTGPESSLLIAQFVDLDIHHTKILRPRE